MSFIKVWAKYLIKYPKKYIESFFANNYGYWYPEAHYWMFAKSLNDEKLNLKKESKLDIELLDSVIEERNIPVVSMITSLGFEFSVTGIMMFYVIYRKKYKMIIIYVPALILWLTAMASSVFCEYRYLFGLIVCLPLIITIALKGYNEEIRTK